MMTGGAVPDLGQRPDLYAQLHALAHHYFKSERHAITLQPTAVLHEAYARLADSDRQHWEDESHFMAVAAGVMRRVLVDYARRRNAERRGGDWSRVELESIEAAGMPSTEITDLDGVLTSLAEDHPRAARVVELRFFAGWSIEQVADSLGISSRTVNLDWRFARAWLRRALDNERT